MPQKKSGATGILVFDFELFIGGLRERSLKGRQLSQVAHESFMLHKRLWFHCPVVYSNIINQTRPVSAERHILAGADVQTAF
jgi:hypothetical protein